MNNRSFHYTDMIAKNGWTSNTTHHLDHIFSTHVVADGIENVPTIPHLKWLQVGGKHLTSSVSKHYFPFLYRKTIWSWSWTLRMPLSRTSEKPYFMLIKLSLCEKMEFEVYILTSVNRNLPFLIFVGFPKKLGP